MTIIWYVIDRQYVADFIMPFFKVIVTINSILVKSYNFMCRTWKNLMGKFFPQLEGLFLTQTCKKYEIFQEPNFWAAEKITPDFANLWHFCPNNIVNPVWPVVEIVAR